ncbi:hypothetical protein PIB30_065401 [Stylosanthes scabra]|uniref:NB-ARC domain-containing protein n=1 Tax=Stylosanthes scabra TaxID=79078 RepID=A0ABU6VKB9_9FABA|nr:hypothetical protein [Stylosanthes scabra]
MLVCVSDDDRDFEVKRVIYQIVKAVSPGDTRVNQNSSLDQLLSLLKQILHEARFLLVLDDIWNEDPMKWDALRGHLESACSSDMNSKGSKIIVTTPRNTVASIVGTKPPILLRGLPYKECWELFVKCAFQEQKEAEQYPRLREIGKAILEKCTGVPLAITTLGCLLRSKQCGEHEWKKIRDSEIWKLDAKDDGILPSLRLSYNHLPQRLKQCFSLCSLYPKDYIYQANQMIMLWMAHGLLQPTNEEEEPEQIGESYINILLSASLLQHEDIPLDVIPMVSATRLYLLTMHDLIHDLAKSTMKESNKTRTIISSKIQEGSGVEWTSHEFKRLKVWDVENTELELLLDDCFVNVKYLRCLRLPEDNMLEKLPSSICKLQILQSLDLSGCKNLLELPKSMRNLVSLGYLFLTFSGTSLSFMDTGNFQQLQWLFIVGCKNLVSLPSALGRLSVLKKLIIFECEELVNFEDEEDEAE